MSTREVVPYYKTYSVANGIPMRVPKSVDNHIYTVIQTQESLNVTSTSGTVQTFYVRYFAFSLLDNAVNLSLVFDQYRIVLVEWWFIPRLTEGATGGNNEGLVSSVTDYDDATALTSVAAANDYQDVIIAPAYCMHYRRFVPHIAVAAYSGAFTSFSNEVAPWIDVASPSVQHYGVKTAAQITTSAVAFDEFFRLTVELRNFR